MKDDVQAALALRDAEFDGSGSSAVDVGNDILVDTQFAFFETGQSVIYSNGGGTDIGGLVDGQTYFVIKVDGQPDQIQLAADRSHVFLETPLAIDLTGFGTGTLHALRDSSSLAEIVTVGVAGGKLTFSAPTADENVVFVRADDSFTVGDVAAALSSSDTSVEFTAGSNRVTAVAAQLDGVAEAGVPSNGVLSADANFRLFVDDVLTCPPKPGPGGMLVLGRWRVGRWRGGQDATEATYRGTDHQQAA